MKIEPFCKLDHLSLDVSRDELEVILGPPAAKRTNRVGLEEFDYGNSFYRFESGGFLSEATIEAEQLEFGETTVLFTSLAQFIASNDPNLVYIHGFILSPVFGVALDPEFPSWVTVLSKKGLEAWQKL